MSGAVSHLGLANSLFSVIVYLLRRGKKIEKWHVTVQRPTSLIGGRLFEIKRQSRVKKKVPSLLLRLRARIQVLKMRHGHGVKARQELTIA